MSKLFVIQSMDAFLFIKSYGILNQNNNFFFVGLVPEQILQNLAGVAPIQSHLLLAEEEAQVTSKF